jgi:putative oxidoreductase
MNNGKNLKSFILSTDRDNKIIYARLITGLIFIFEGIMKYLFLEMLGPGRFAQIGFNHAIFWAYFTGAFEISCGFLVLSGLFTRLASIPLLIIMITAFITTKLPVLATKGVWTFLHEYRTDFSLTVLLILLIIYGGGNWSLDLKIFQSKGS